MNQVVELFGILCSIFCDTEHPNSDHNTETIHHLLTPSLNKSKGGGQNTLLVRFCFREGTLAK